jgi:hypothetical protein
MLSVVDAEVVAGPLLASTRDTTAAGDQLRVR